MISFVQDGLAIGNESDAANESFLSDKGITAVLNVAAEVMPPHYQSDIISAKVGLVDGPGNYPSLYTVAIQILDVLSTEGEMVGDLQVTFIIQYPNGVNTLRRWHFSVTLHCRLLSGAETRHFLQRS